MPETADGEETEMTQEQIEQAKACRTKEEILAFIQENSVDLSEEQMDYAVLRLPYIQFNDIRSVFYRHLKRRKRILRSLLRCTSMRSYSYLIHIVSMKRYYISSNKDEKYNVDDYRYHCNSNED